MQKAGAGVQICEAGPAGILFRGFEEALNIPRRNMQVLKASLQDSLKFGRSGEFAPPRSRNKHGVPVNVAQKSFACHPTATDGRIHYLQKVPALAPDHYEMGYTAGQLDYN
jgi:hypothetical protein